MKKFILNIIQFLLFSIFSYLVLLIIWGELLNPRLYFNLRYDKGVNDILHYKMEEIESDKLGEVDILFLGSSHTYRTFDPRIFSNSGINIFNLGSSSQSHIQTGLLLDAYIDDIHPKLVVYDVYPSIFAIDGVESTVDFITNEFPINKMNDLILGQNNLKIYNSLLFRIYKKITGQQYREYHRETAEDRYVDGGFLEFMGEDKLDELLVDSLTLKMKSEQLLAFKNNLDYLHYKGHKVLLVDVPVTNKLYKSYTNMDKVKEELSQYGQVYYFQDSVALTDSVHFFDCNHLNQKGVKVFDDYFINWIQNL